jgi:hypothetical protein
MNAQTKTTLSTVGWTTAAALIAAIIIFAFALAGWHLGGGLQ